MCKANDKWKMIKNYIHTWRGRNTKHHKLFWFHHGLGKQTANLAAAVEVVCVQIFCGGGAGTLRGAGAEVMSCVQGRFKALIPKFFHLRIGTLSSF